MTVENVVWMLTALAAVVVLLTRARLSAVQTQSGRAETPSIVLNSHTAVGIGALVTWVLYLSTIGGRPMGAAALLLWWLEVVIGLLILARWLPGSGRHSTGSTDDNWAQGPWLSVLAHVGLLGGIIFFTFVVVTDRL